VSRREQSVLDKKAYCNICAQNREFIKLFTHHDNTYFVDKKKFTLVKCAACQVATIQNKPNPKQLKKYYERNYYSYDTSASFFFRLKEKWADRANQIKNEALANRLVFGLLFKRATTPNAKVLDIGCGDGSALSMLKRMGYDHLYGSEIDPELCKRVEKKGIKTFCTVDITDAKLKNHFFDLVRMSHVLEHVYNPRETIVFLRDKISPNGSLMIGVPNSGSLAARLFGRYFCGLQLPTHLYQFNKKNIKQLLHDENFELVDLRTTGFSGISYSLLTVLKDKLGIKEIPNTIAMLLVGLFLPLEVLLNAIGQGYILNVRAVKREAE